MAEAETVSKRPDIVRDRHLVYLDAVRDSGAMNMFGASGAISSKFGVDKETATKILVYWMETYGKEDR